MPSTFSTSLQLELQATGENSNTWGDKANTNLELIEQAIAGVASVAMTDADYTLVTSSAALDEARNMVITMTGTTTQARNVIVPAVDKLYVVKNSTTGGFGIVVKTSGGTGVTIPNGETATVYCDATNVVLAETGGATTTVLVGGGVGSLPVWTAATGSGAPVRATSPTLVTPALGTPSSLVGTNITGTAAGLTAGVASAVAVGGITGLGTNVATALAVNVGSAGAPVLFNGAGGTPSSMVGTNISGTAAALTAGAASAVALGGITGLGTGVATALAANVGSAGAPVVFNGAGGTPSSMVGTNISGTAAALTAGNVTTNANLTGHVTSVGNAAVLGSFTIAQLSAAISDANISGTNTGDQTNITGNAATVTTNANLTGHVTSVGNAAVLGSFTLAQLNTAISDGDVPIAATQADQETGSSTTTYVSPGRQQYHPSAAKGWVRFDATGAVSVSHNVASVTDSGVGAWTVNWATDFSSAVHCDEVTLEKTITGAATTLVAQVNDTITAGTTGITCVDSTTITLRDPSYVHVTAFGDQA